MKIGIPKITSKKAQDPDQVQEPVSEQASTKPRKQGGPVAFLKEYKKQLITTAITAVACLLVCGVANTAADIFRATAADAQAAMNNKQNEIDTFRTSDRYFTASDEQKDYNQIRIEWVSSRWVDKANPTEEEKRNTIADTARWRADEDIFWDFISPAFNFNSATEYNKMREDYINQVGNCLFTVQFLAYYDIESKCRVNENGTVNQVDFERYDKAYTCTSDKSKFRTYPVSVDINGDYTYVALVPMKSSYVMFTYKIVHGVGQGGRERITLADFDCWPPNSGERMGVG